MLSFSSASAASTAAASTPATASTSAAPASSAAASSSSSSAEPSLDELRALLFPPPDQVVVLNVSGEQMATAAATFRRRCPNSALARLFSDENRPKLNRDAQNRVIIDADAASFSRILGESDKRCVLVAVLWRQFQVILSCFVWRPAIE